MSTRNKSCITLSLVTQFAKFSSFSISKRLVHVGVLAARDDGFFLYGLMLLVLHSGLDLLLLRVILLNYLAFVLVGVRLSLVSASLITLVSSFLGILYLVFHNYITSVLIVVLLLFTIVVLGLVSLRYLLLLNETRNRLALVLPHTSLLVDDRHSLQVGDVRAFDNEYCTSNLDYVANFKWV
jgi:hypothetical protein